MGRKDKEITGLCVCCSLRKSLASMSFVKGKLVCITCQKKFENSKCPIVEKGNLSVKIRFGGD